MGDFVPNNGEGRIQTYGTFRHIRFQVDHGKRPLSGVEGDAGWGCWLIPKETLRERLRSANDISGTVTIHAISAEIFADELHSGVLISGSRGSATANIKDRLLGLLLYIVF
ncbi:MAG: hypothetical protein AAF808_03770 [Cyanobacteria bacterium P01_D01_bin.2]